MGNAYLDGVNGKRRSALMRPLLLWVLLVVMFLAIWQLMSPTPDSAPRASRPPSRHHVAAVEEKERPPSDSPLTPTTTILLGFVVFPLLMTFLVRRQLRHAAHIRTADRLLLEEDLAGAIAEARLALKRAVGHPRFQALILLGQCAERRGDFNEASEIYAQAATAIPKMMGTSLLQSQIVPMANARRAFVLAAADRLDEAEALLAIPPPKEALPGTHAFAVRARAIVDSKRGRYRQLLDGLASSRAALRETLPLREQILLRMVAAHARIAIADANRGAHSPPIFAHPELASWIARVVPRVPPVLEGAS